MMLGNATTAVHLAIADIPAFPACARVVLDALADPDIPMSRVARLIGADPGLGARVLHTANSAYYGMPRQVGSLMAATALLGLQTMRSIVLMSGIRDAMSVRLPAYDASAGVLWVHCCRTARIAEQITLRSGRRQPWEAFAAGLLHDVGKVVLGAMKARSTGQALPLAAESADSLCALEAREFGLDHAEAGAIIARHWGLPDPLSEAIAEHHAPRGGGEWEWLSAVTHIADAVETHAGARLGLTPPIDLFTPASLGLEPEDVTAACAAADRSGANQVCA